MNPAAAALLVGATCIALSPIFVRVSEAGPTATAFWRAARQPGVDLRHPRRLDLPEAAADAALPRRPRRRAHRRHAAPARERRVLFDRPCRRYARRCHGDVLRRLYPRRFPVALASGEQMLPGSAYGWWILIGLALVSHAAGQGLIAYALASLPAALRLMLLSEALVPLQALGGIIVLGGIYLARRGSRAAE